MSTVFEELQAHRTPPSRSRFAPILALAMLAINLVGFAPTLYLRPLFDPPPIPLYLYIHGVLGTAWFVLVSAQALLVANRRIVVHRRLGWVGAGIAAAVLVSGIVTSANMVARNFALGLTSDADIALYTAVTIADNAAFIVFPALVLLAIVFRRRVQVHKRLMLLASVSILGPALARIASWFGPFPNGIAPMVLLAFIGSLLVYDLISLRRLHLASVLGILLLIGVFAGMRQSGIGSALVEARIQEATAPQ